jgi:hypothetical protein
MFDFHLSSLSSPFGSFILNTNEWNCISCICRSLGELTSNIMHSRYHEIDFPTQKEANCLAEALKFVLEGLDEGLIEVNTGIWQKGDKYKEGRIRPDKDWYAVWHINRKKLENFIEFVEASGGFMSGHPLDWYVRQRRGLARPIL